MRTIRDEDASSSGARYEARSVVQETERAILVELAQGGQRWIPKSVLRPDSEVYEQGHAGALIVHGWWASEHMADVGDLGGGASGKPRGTGRAIGVSDLAAVQKLLEGKGVHKVEFTGPEVFVRYDAGKPSQGTTRGKDLTEAVRALDAARRG